MKRSQIGHNCRWVPLAQAVRFASRIADRLHRCKQKSSRHLLEQLLLYENQRKSLSADFRKSNPRSNPFCPFGPEDIGRRTTKRNRERSVPRVSLVTFAMARESSLDLTELHVHPDSP